MLLLLYGAGLRISEALALTVADTDLIAGVLTIRDTEFYKTRLVPVGPDLKSVLGLLPFRPQRARPYLYSELEIQELLAAALKLTPRQGLRPWTYHVLFGLLAVGGLRISETLKLEDPDVDLSEGILTIRQTKFGTTRLVRSTGPLGMSWPITSVAAIGSCTAHRLPVSSSTITAAAWSPPPCVERSTNCHGRSACAGRRITKARAFTIFGIDSLSVR